MKVHSNIQIKLGKNQKLFFSIQYQVAKILIYRRYIALTSRHSVVSLLDIDISTYEYAF
jgi:hypothetical protein